MNYKKRATPKSDRQLKAEREQQEREDRERRIRDRDYYRSEGYSGRAQAVSTTGGNGAFDYACSRCGEPAYYDGRCGDGPILMCKCNAAEDAYWANDRR